MQFLKFYLHGQASTCPNGSLHDAYFCSFSVYQQILFLGFIYVLILGKFKINYFEIYIQAPTSN